MVPASREFADALATEVARILENPVLARAPSQSRILAYLSDIAQRGESGASQYAIAVDVLGKGEDFDEATDSSVRVQVGRLRRSLLEYYRLNQPGDSHCIYIRSGEYQLRMGPVQIAYPDLGREPRDAARPEFPAPEPDPVVPMTTRIDDANHKASTGSGGMCMFTLAAFAALAVIMIAVAAYFYMQDPPGPQAEKTLVAAPVIEKELRIVGGLRRDLEASDQIEVLGNDIDLLLQKSMMSRTTVDRDEASGNYRLMVSMMREEAGAIELFISLRSPDGDLISEHSQEVASIGDLRGVITDEVVGIVSPASPFGYHLADSITGEPNSGFECFISIETFRAAGVHELPFLEQCTKKFGEGEFGGYFAARKVARAIQMHRKRGGSVSKALPEWTQIQDTLREYPADPFANAVAAKMLIGAGACGEAKEFMERGFSRGRTYPALELALIVDAYGCAASRDEQLLWSNRIERLAKIRTVQRSPLLEAYLLIGSIAADREGIVRLSNDRQFAGGNAIELRQLNGALDSYIAGTLTEQELRLIETGLPRLIWNNDTVALVKAKLAQRVVR